jgi:hypothetical protein
MTTPATDTIVSRRLGTVKAASTPQVFNGVIWFQGEDNKLWAMRIEDAEHAVNPHGLDCLASPTPANNGFVYFPTKDNVLIILSQRVPWLHTNTWNWIHSTPPVIATPSGDFFAAHKDSVGVVLNGKFAGVAKFDFDITDFTVGHVGGSTYLYVSNKVSMKLQARNITTPTEAIVNSTVEVIDGPVFTRSGRLFVVQKGNGYIELDPLTLAAKTTLPLFSFCLTTPVETPYGEDGFVYSISTANELLMTKQSDPTFKKRISNNAYAGADSNGHPYARPFPFGNGNVVFLDDEKYINLATITLAPVTA